jgi:hypothetical protein
MYIRYFLGALLALLCLHRAWSITELEELSLCARSVFIASIQDPKTAVVLKNASYDERHLGLTLQKVECKNGGVLKSNVSIPEDGRLMCLLDQELGRGPFSLIFDMFKYFPSFQVPEISKIGIDGCACIAYIDPSFAFPKLKHLAFNKVCSFWHKNSVTGGEQNIGTEMAHLFGKLGQKSAVILLNTSKMDGPEKVARHPLLSQHLGVATGPWWMGFDGPPRQRSEAIREGVHNFKDVLIEDLWTARSGLDMVRILWLGQTQGGISNRWKVYQVITGMFDRKDCDDRGQTPSCVLEKDRKPDCFDVHVQWKAALNEDPFFEVRLDSEAIEKSMCVRAASFSENITENILTILALGKWCDSVSLIDAWLEPTPPTPKKPVVRPDVQLLSSVPSSLSSRPKIVISPRPRGRMRSGHREYVPSPLSSSWTCPQPSSQNPAPSSDAPGPTC